MKIIYTKHAEEQIKDRKLEKVWIEEAIKNPDKTIRDGENHICRKKLNGLTIKTIYAKENYIKIITSYPV